MRKATFWSRSRKSKHRRKNLDAIQKDAQSAREGIRNAENGLQDLQKQTEQVSQFKTFEFVTLFRDRSAEVTLNNVQEQPGTDGTNRLRSILYTLNFSTGAISHSMKIDVTVSSRNKSHKWHYSVGDPKNAGATRPSYCICETPFMFQIDNVIHTYILRDYATVKVLGRGESCQPPEHITEGACAR